MRALIVGSGASYAESLAIGAPANLQMPLMKNFAQLLWDDFHPGQSLIDFLNSKGRTCSPDEALKEFKLCEYQANTEINIEQYFEFLWNYRSTYRTEYGIDWWNILYHGLLQPILLRMGTVFHQNGVGWRKFPESDHVATRLRPNDIVLNLNYDTVFDIALWRMHAGVCYTPNRTNNKCIIVAKPHGSLNLLVSDKGFSFGDPENTGALPPKGAGFHFGFLPPRLHKHYRQHEIAERILRGISTLRPTTLTFWGIGMTASDLDLMDLYQRWLASAVTVEAINPSKVDVDRISRYLNAPVTQFASVTD